MIDLPDFTRVRVLVAGDLMLDRYWHGAAGRISPEAPVPVVRVEDEEHRPGGAANVAQNIAALGGGACIVGLVGDDEPGRTLAGLLEATGVDCCFETTSSAPTITKLRITSRQQQLIRLDFETGFSDADETGLLERYRRRLADVDLVVLSDYAKGTLGDPQAWITTAREARKAVLVDPKRSDIAAYRGADLLTPNLAELEAMVGPCPDEQTLVERGMALLHEHDFGALLVTRGEKGVTLLQGGEPPRHLPTYAREVFDVTGAGDTVISVLAAGLAAGLPLSSATQLANYAAGVVVSKLGTASVSMDELQAALHEHQVIRRVGCRPSTDCSTGPVDPTTTIRGRDASGAATVAAGLVTSATAKSVLANLQSGEFGCGEAPQRQFAGQIDDRP